MNKRKIIISAIGVLIFVWMLTTAYFYTQHKRHVERITINEYVELGGYSIYLMDVEKYNFKPVNNNGDEFLVSVGDNTSSELFELTIVYEGAYWWIVGLD